MKHHFLLVLGLNAHVRIVDLFGPALKLSVALSIFSVRLAVTSEFAAIMESAHALAASILSSSRKLTYWY